MINLRKNHPLIKIANNALVDLPAPINISYVNMTLKYLPSSPPSQGDRTYTTVKLWNSLPNKIKTEETYSGFCSSLKLHILKQRENEFTS